MRKKLILIITALLLVMCSLLTACTFELDLDSCTGTKHPGTSDEIIDELPPEENVVIDKAFSFQVEEDDGWYYPTFIGIVTLDYCPDKVTVVCNGKETLLKPVKVDYVNKLYEIRYEQQIIYSLLKKGNYNATVYSYLKSTKKILTQMLTLNVDSDYSAVNVYNWTTNKSSVAMDKTHDYSGEH